MDIDLPDHDFQAWMHHLPKYFRALNDHFPSEGASTCLGCLEAANKRARRLMKAQVQQDTLLTEIIAAQGDDGELCLVKIENGAQVLRIVQHFMRLALGHSSPPATAPCPSSSQNNTEPSGGQQQPGHPIYTSVPLSDSSSQMRLIKLLPGHDDDPIAVSLFVTERGSNQYEALSYVWGSRDADVSITVSGKPFEVSANLAEALRCLRHKDVTRVMWIDAICINQSDNAEKSAQVAMMGDLYRNAADVVIFLGGEKDDSDLVMQYLALEDEADGSDSSEASRGLPAHMEDPEDYERAKKHILGRIQRRGLDTAQFFGAADAFFKRLWWARVWTVQEFALARREHLWCCGRRSISSPRLREELICLVHYLAKEAQPGAGSPEIITNPQIGAEGQYATLVQTRYIIALLLTPRSAQWEALRFMETITRFQYRQSTDSRDYIYALREMLSLIPKHIFVPDYSVTADKLFVKASSYLLLSEDRIDRLYARFELLHSPSMSSWALNFARPLSPVAQGHHWHGVLPNKSQPRSPSHRPAVLGRTLRISGIILDILDAVISPEDASSDMDKLRRLWRAQGLLRHHQPPEAVPEAAKKIWTPGTCLLPLVDAAGPGRRAITSPFTWPITTVIPGFASFCLVVVTVMASASLGPRFRPENLTCQKWEDARRLSPSGSKLLERANLVLIQSMGDPETFYAGACFDPDNLKAKILGFKYRGDANPESPSPLGGETDAVDQTPVEEKRVGGKTAPAQEGYVPQYARITGLLREATSEPELRMLQDYLLGMADHCRKIRDGTATPTDALALKVMPDVWQERRLEAVSSYREILENCSCGEGERDKHQRLMKKLIENAEDAAGRLRPCWDEAAAKFAIIPADSIRPASKLLQTWNRELCSIFTTRRGFAGFTFQRQSCLGKGDVLAVLDGMPAPVVLEQVAHGTEYRLKALINMHGINVLDIDKVTELGVCVRREFDIV